MDNNQLSLEDKIMRTAKTVGDTLQSTVLKLTDDDDENHGMLWIRGQQDTPF